RRHTRSDRDWSSDVCSSDLVRATGMIGASWDPAMSPAVTPAGSFSDVVGFTIDVALGFSEDVFDTTGMVNERIAGVLARDVGFRSEERRVGKERRSRWSPAH